MNPDSRSYSIKVTVIVLLAAVVGAWGFYKIMIDGTTDGPDFVQILKTGGGDDGSISSIEVVEAAVGHTPFKASEYESLPRWTIITAAAAVSRLLELLKNAQSGSIYQNHPGTYDRVYLKVNGKDGFFWLYLSVLKDAKGSVLMVRANTCNAVNPNGASEYHLDDYSEVLGLLKYDQVTASGHAEKGADSWNGSLTSVR